MNKIKKIKNLLVCILIIILALQSTVFAADLRFMEIDEISESGYLSLSGTTVSGVPPFRNSSMQPIFTQVNSQYSEPRPTVDAGMHRGVDLKSVDSLGAMKIYPILGDGQIFQVDNAQTTSYGKYVKLQHSYLYNSNRYYFQTLSAHLSVISCPTSGTLSLNSLIGTSGGTNLAGQPNFATHLHLETRGASSSYTTATRKYPPNFFFGTLSSTVTNKMAFINRTAASASSVTFKIAPVITGTEYTTPLNMVTFKYKADSGAWTTGTMTTTDNLYFTANLSGLYTSKIEYYVVAKSDAWTFGSWLDSYRPYRYSDAVPSDRPFVQYKTGMVAMDNASATTGIENYATALEPEDKDLVTSAQNKSENKTIRLLGIVTGISDDWAVTIKAQDNKDYIIKIKDKNATGSPLVLGEKIGISCEVNEIDGTLSAVGADILVYSVYEGATY